MPRGLLAAQVTHAAGETGPVAPGAHAIVLAVPDEATLQGWGTALANKGPPFVSISDEDGHLMALGIRPGRRSTLKKHFSSLPLLR